MNPWVTAIIGGLLGTVLGSNIAKNRAKKEAREALRALPDRIPSTVLAISDAVPAGDDVFVAGPACTGWSVIDQPRLELLTRHAYYTARLNGVNEPYQITDVVISRVMPQCRNRMTGIRNPDELDLYAMLFTSVAEMLYTEGVLSDQAWTAYAEDFDDWYETTKGRFV